MAEPRRSLPTPVHVGGARFLVVEARFYDDIGAMLFAGAARALAAAGATVEVVGVPGALEIPVALAMSLDIRGETYHFEIVCNESARALTQLAVAGRLCFGSGILTVEDEAQALERADPARGDKGGDAARAALALWRVKHGGDA